MSNSRNNTARTRARDWHPIFLAELRRTGIIGKACDAAEVDRTTAYRHRDQDEDFATAWREALEYATDTVEAEARRRAVEGVEEPVFGRVARDEDGQIGTVRKYSDTLTLALLKAHRPELYRDRKDLHHSGAVTITDLVRQFDDSDGDTSA